MAKTHSHRDARKPITIDLLEVIVSNLQFICSSSYEYTLFKAVYCCAFFGFFRVGELVQAGLPQKALIIEDIKLSRDGKSVIFYLKSSKADKYHRGVHICISAIPSHPLCPVTAMSKYLALRPHGPSQAFVHWNNSALTRYQFQAILKKSLNYSGINADNYTSHSFRIGAATTAASLGLSPALIQHFGRWGSDSYKSYIRISLM